MVEPIGITLGAVGLLAPIYDACSRLYHTYKLTESFGSDFQVAELQLRMQYCRLDVTSRKRLLDLENPIDSDNAKHASTQVVIEVLSLIKSQFELSSKLIRKYDKSGELVDDGNGAQSSISTNLSSLQTSHETEVSSSTSIESQAQLTQPKKKSKLRQLLSRLHGPGIKSPIKTISNSDATAHAALNFQVVKTANQQHIQQSRALQTSSPFFNRVTWARKDKETLYQIIKVLKNSNNFLESILVCKPPESPITLVSSKEFPIATEYVRSVEKTQGHLGKLHEGLRYMNNEGNGHGPWKWTIQLSSDYISESGNTCKALYGLPLRRPEWQYQYFNLKRHLNQRRPEASFFAAESSRSVYGHETDPKELAEHLDQPEIFKPNDPVGGFKNWGLVKTDDLGDGMHRLFHAEKQISHVTGTLSGMLKNENARRMTPRQRVELATLIASSYTYFWTVRPKCQDIQPLSFIYYSTSEGDDAWTDGNLPILKPYLDFGFGQRPPQKMLGESSGVSRSQNAVIVELGLLLYQVGSCTSLKYGLSSRALAEARRTAGFNLHLLDRTVSMAFAEVTEACLQYSANAARIVGDEGLEKFLQGVAWRLLDMQEKLY